MSKPLVWKMRSKIGNLVELFSPDPQTNPTNKLMTISITEGSGYNTKSPIYNEVRPLEFTEEEFQSLRKVVAIELVRQGKTGTTTGSQIADAFLAFRYLGDEDQNLGAKFVYLEIIEKHPRASELSYAVKQMSAELAFSTGAHNGIISYEEIESLLHKGIDQALEGKPAPAKDEDDDLSW